ncbi:MAG: AraC family transcriptional regulator [Treponema sp.]
MNEKSGLYFYYCGHEKCSSGHSFGPAVRAHYLVHIIMKGKGIYSHGTQTVTAGKHQAFLIRPQEVTFYEADKDDPWEYLWFAFDGRDAQHLISSFFSDESALVISATNPSRLDELIAVALPSFRKRAQSQLELNGWCHLFFSCFKNHIYNVPKDCKNTYLTKALQYIGSHYMQDINIDQLSTSLKIDRTYLYKIIKKYTGTSPKEYITVLRITAAKNMLQYSQYSMTEIAFACGFHDHSSFCKTFKRYEGETPSQYRERFLR